MIPERSSSLCFCTSAEPRSRTLFAFPTAVSPFPSAPWQATHFVLYSASPPPCACATPLKRVIPITATQAVTATIHFPLFFIFSPDPYLTRAQKSWPIPFLREPAISPASAFSSTSRRTALQQSYVEKQPNKRYQDEDYCNSQPSSTIIPLRQCIFSRLQIFRRNGQSGLDVLMHQRRLEAM